MKQFFTTLFITVALFAMAQNNSESNAATLPYAYDFETSDLDGWTVINKGQAKQWQRTKNNGGKQVLASKGEYFMRYSYDLKIDANTWMFSRPLQLLAGQKIKIS